MRGTFHFEETAASRRSHGDEDFHPLNVTKQFSALLECKRCQEIVACCGDGGYEPEEYTDPDGNYVYDFAPVFFVRYFSMPMLIFNPSPKTPPKVKARLLESFLVFFCDLSAAANHIRQCAEEILTDACIPLKKPNGAFMRLDDRIKEFEKNDPENADRVSALRWIGNFGSHPETLSPDDVFNAYDILEVLLEDVYVGHHRSVRELVTRINKAKRP